MRRKLLSMLVVVMLLATPVVSFADWGPGQSYIGGPIMHWDTMVDQLYEMEAVSDNMTVYTLEERFGEDKTSERGRPLHYVQMGNGDTVVWIQAQIHGNEKLTTVGMLEWMWEYALDADYAASLADLTIIAIPIYNPDGCILAQRGTDVYNAAGVRTNANFDLNRDWKVNLASEGMGFVAAESRNWFQLWGDVKADWALDLHHQGAGTFTPTRTDIHGTGARAFTGSMGVALFIDGPTLPRIKDGRFNTEMKQMYSYVYENIKEDVRDMLYPFWAAGYGSQANMNNNVSYNENFKRWYPINMYAGIEIFGGVVSGMSLGIDYNGYNPWNWAAPHIFIETEQQHTGWGTGTSSAARPLSERWYSLAMQNYYGIKAFAVATSTGEYKDVDPADYYRVPYTQSSARPANPSSRDYNVAAAAALDFSWMDARYAGIAWVDAYVTKLNGNKNDLTITVYEKWTDKSVRTFETKFSINNNAEGVYAVDGSEDYKVYVDTKGNVQIRACYFVE